MRSPARSGGPFMLSGVLAGARQGRQHRARASTGWIEGRRGAHAAPAPQGPRLLGGGRDGRQTAHASLLWSDLPHHNAPAQQPML